MPKTICQRCRGTTYIEVVETKKCPYCKGLGTTRGGTKKCTNCNGYGETYETNRYPCPAQCENGYIEY